MRKKGRPHLEEISSYRVGHADDAVDTRVQVAHPGHRIQKADGADNAAVANDFDRQALAGAQAVADRLVVEGVHDVVTAANQFAAKRRDPLRVEVLPQSNIDRRYTGGQQRGCWDDRRGRSR